VFDFGIGWRKVDRKGGRVGRWFCEKAYFPLKNTGLNECKLIVDEERSKDSDEEDYMYQKSPIM
jgi:hypothetical protein